MAGSKRARRTAARVAHRGRTGLRYGRVPVAHDASRPVEPVCLGTSRLARIVDYPARDMTITVEAGVRVADLQRTLAAEGQRLAVDLPHPERATIGGALAVNAAGPRRYGLGTLRDYLIGVSAVDGRGRTFKAGGGSSRTWRGTTCASCWWGLWERWPSSPRRR